MSKLPMLNLSGGGGGLFVQSGQGEILNFSSFPQLGSSILESVEQNTLSVEPVGFQPLPVVKASAVECGGPK